MSVYYNEIDAYCVQWLRNLMDAELIPHGDIDTRSIEDVRPDDLRGYTQCHFFAGLGGWAYALQLAGWGTRPVWTGSCPCQPFSAAGKGLGFADERHLWPSWQHLISQCAPPVIFGEQVASATDWLGLVSGDLEALGYAVGAIPIEAASAGADQRRDRLWFVADTERACDRREVECGEAGQAQTNGSSSGFSGSSHGVALADTYQLGASEGRQQRSGQFGRAGSHSKNSVVVDAACELPYWRGNSGANGRREYPNASSWVIGHDGKARRVEPSIRLLAHGVSARVGKLRALGNAIDPRSAAAFIQAYIEAKGLNS
jgi:DNA (cytosine-5)-methyltransferase 1